MFISIIDSISDTHPSPPINVTVENVSERTVQIKWEQPETNAHLVNNYTLFIRKNGHGSVMKEVTKTIHLTSLFIPFIDIECDESTY